MTTREETSRRYWHGVLNDGGANIPQWDPNDPDGGADFHAFSTADRFNFNGPGFNFLRTPNERVNVYANVRHDLAPNVTLFARGSYTNRSSETKAAPEPLCLGAGCGTRITDNFVISATNPYNFTGLDLSVANGNLEFFGRRPLESGGRLFFQLYLVAHDFDDLGGGGDILLSGQDLEPDHRILGTADQFDHVVDAPADDIHHLAVLALADRRDTVTGFEPSVLGDRAAGHHA